MLETNQDNYSKIIRFLYKFFMIGTVAGILFVLAVNFNFLWLFGGMPSLQELENPKSQAASLIISEDGQEIGKYFRENRNPLEFEQLPLNIVNKLMLGRILFGI